MKRFLVRTGMAGGLLIAGMLLGIVGGRLPVFASSNHIQSTTPPRVTNGDYCQFYEMTLANELHVSTSALEQANVAALQQTIDQLAKQGKITPLEQMVLETALTKAGKDPCKNLPTAASALFGNPVVMQPFAAIHTKLIDAVAASLHVSPSSLEQDLSSGKTIPQIAQAQHVPVSVVNTAYLQSVKSLLAQYVQNQAITQEQSDWLYRLVVQAVSGSHYPLLDRK